MDRGWTWLRFFYTFLSAVDVILFIVLNVIKGFIKGRKMEQPLSIFLLEFSFALFAVYFVDLALENVCMKMTAKIIFCIFYYWRYCHQANLCCKLAFHIDY